MTIEEARNVGFKDRNEIPDRNEREQTNREAGQKIDNIFIKKDFFKFVNSYEAKEYKLEEVENWINKPIRERKEILKEFPALKKLVAEFNNKSFNKTFTEKINKKLENINISVYMWNESKLENKKYFKLNIMKKDKYSSDYYFYGFEECLYTENEQGRPRINAGKVIEKIDYLEKSMRREIEKYEESRKEEEIRALYKKIVDLQEQAKKYNRDVLEHLYNIDTRKMYGY